MNAETVNNGSDLALAPEERPAAPQPAQPAARLRRSWARMRFPVRAKLGEATAASAVPAFVAEEGGSRPPKAAKHRKSWREQRWERRRKRRMFEEVLGWILVPIILISGYWGIKSGLNALGTTPTALIQGIKTAISSRGG